MGCVRSDHDCDCGFDAAIKDVERKLAWLACLEQTLDDEGMGGSGVRSRAMERFEPRGDAM
jgi:hypothetical protein